MAYPTLADRHASGPDAPLKYRFTLVLETSNRCRRVAVKPSPLSPPGDPQAVHRTGPGYSGIRVVLGIVPAESMCKFRASVRIKFAFPCPASPTDRLDIC
jgi:hypothetical protein